MTDATTVTAAPSDDAPYPKESYAWYVIGVLFAVTLFSYIDRQLPSLLVRPLREAFDINDTEFSYLQGMSFAVVYALAGLPCGRFIDRANRRNLVVVGLVIWSVMTILCGLAQDYWQLFAARMGVGIGEAVLAPAAYSIISDYVEPHKRGRAIGIYYTSLAAGAGLSLLAGGMLLGMLPEAGLVWPLLGHLEPWQLTFIFAGAPGLLLVLPMLTVREPVRRDANRFRAEVQGGTFPEILKHMGRHKATFTRILIYPTLIGVLNYGALAWAPAFFARKFDIAQANAGFMVGGALALSGLTGTLLSAFLSDHWAARGLPGARFRVTILSCLIIVPASALWPLAPSAPLCLALLALMTGGSAIAQSAVPTLIQEVTPNRMRGQMVALYLMIASLAGIGFGPTAVALVTDGVFHDDKALPYSLVLVGFPMALIALWLCVTGLKPYGKTVAALEAGEG